jgi:hydroxymethylpyrimidine pyrophosphatase-like HAD family hydrolase
VQAPRLVASDVDGTLLDAEERVPPRTVAVVERLVAAGAGFVLVTGRPPRWIPPVTAQLEVATLAVCANGSVLYDVTADRVLWASTLAPDALAAIAAAATAVLPQCRLAVERVDLGAPFVAEAGYRHAWVDGDGVAADRPELLGEPAV